MTAYLPESAHDSEDQQIVEFALSMVNEQIVTRETSPYLPTAAARAPHNNQTSKFSRINHHVKSGTATSPLLLLPDTTL